MMKIQLAHVMQTERNFVVHSRFVITAWQQKTERMEFWELSMAEFYEDCCRRPRWTMSATKKQKTSQKIRCSAEHIQKNAESGIVQISMRTIEAQVGSSAEQIFRTCENMLNFKGWKQM